MMEPAKHRTPKETKDHHISSMGEELGRLFYALWQEVVWLHREWHEYVLLFGTKKSRIALMNDAAPEFFRIIQDGLFDLIVLRIARLTDPPKSVGKSNLTIQQLPLLIHDNPPQKTVIDLVNSAVAAANSCRERRHRHLAHRDLDLSLGVATNPLSNMTRANIDDAIAALAKILNAVSSHYLHSTTEFRSVSTHGGSVALLRIIDDGLERRAKRMADLERGEVPGGVERRRRQNL